MSATTPPATSATSHTGAPLSAAGATGATTAGAWVGAGVTGATTAGASLSGASDGWTSLGGSVIPGELPSPHTVPISRSSATIANGSDSPLL